MLRLNKPYILWIITLKKCITYLGVVICVLDTNKGLLIRTLALDSCITACEVFSKFNPIKPANYI